MVESENHTLIPYHVSITKIPKTTLACSTQGPVSSTGAYPCVLLVFTSHRIMDVGELRADYLAADDVDFGSR